MPDQARHDEAVSGGPAQTLPTPRQASFVVTKWDRALARFRRAEAGLAAVAHTEDDDLYDRLLGRFNRALRALVRAPAPDMGAFCVKLDLAVDHEVATLTGGEACMAALKRDARRLTFGGHRQHLHAHPAPTQRLHP